MDILRRLSSGKGPPPSRLAEILRVVVGLIWLAGAGFNALVTWRMAEPFGWLAEGSWFAPWRRFFGEVVDSNRSFWIALLVVGEAALGLLTLGRGVSARVGLAGGALFSMLLLSLGTSYTLVMGPYALLVGRLARYRYGRSLIDYLPSPRHARSRRATADGG